jgi:hypothetical protein
VSGHLAAVDLDALADADEAEAEAVVGCAASTVVADVDPQFVSSVADGHVGVLGVGVLERVGQAFLDDAIGGQVDGRWESDGVALDVQPDGKAGAADLFEQRVEVVEARLWGELEIFAVAAHRTEQASHLRDGGAPRLLDSAERVPVLGLRIHWPHRPLPSH